MAPTLLSALTTKTESCTIKVKVLRLWDATNLSTNEHISTDMILSDKKVQSLDISIYNLITLLDSKFANILFLCRAKLSMLQLGTS